MVRPVSGKAPGSSAAQVVADAPVGAASDEAAVRALVAGADALTFEHEHVPGALLDALADDLLALVLEVASGRARANNERNGYREIAIWKGGVTL